MYPAGFETFSIISKRVSKDFGPLALLRIVPAHNITLCDHELAIEGFIYVCALSGHIHAREHHQISILF